jgi:hypothetical protein
VRERNGKRQLRKNMIRGYDRRKMAFQLDGK